MSEADRMKDFEERMKKRGQRPEEQPLQQQMPWTAKIENALQAQIAKSIHCQACNHKNQPKSVPILYVVRFELMREMIPMPTYVCNNCGTHFTPTAFRKILKAAMQKQEKAMKQHAEAAGGKQGG